jgi:predicted nucleic acid-binding protein
MDAVADGRIERPLTAWHCCLEFYSVTTRLPEEYRLKPETALRFLREEIFPRFSVQDLPAELREEFLVSTVGESTAGGRIYDAHIAEIARQAGAQLVVTENRRHFTSLLRHGIRVLVSEELAGEIES